MGSPSTHPVREIMHREVATVRRNDALDVADEKMAQGRFRHLVVLDEEGAIVGVISRRDLFRGALATAMGYGERAQLNVLRTLVAKEVMTSPVRTVGPETTVAEAGRLLLDLQIGCLPVVDGERLVGIVTVTDLLRLLV